MFSSSWRGMRVKPSSVPSQAMETGPYFSASFAAMPEKLPVTA